jgi:hypothetical protein
MPLIIPFDEWLEISSKTLEDSFPFWTRADELM